MIGEEVEACLTRLDEHELHPLATSDAGHFSGASKARTRRRRFRKVEHGNPLLAVVILLVSIPLCFPIG